MFSNIYRGKKVLVTGHTGFKGAWLCQWLLKLGADVFGYSIDIPTKPSLFKVLNLEERISHILGDVRNLGDLSSLILREKPDFIFHLAAQAIVSTSYRDPVTTVSTNVIGTMNILESLRDVEHNCVVVMVTSDKCYENVEWLWGYKETDQIGGKDVYSGSKGAAELIIHSYVQSFFNSNSYVRIGIGRAGNVIGGGDWALDRIVVDTVKAWSEKKSVEIRCPDATRPWQHVLEPLSGYLRLAESLGQSDAVNHEAFNFGPSTPETQKVTELLSDMYREWSTSSRDCFEPFIVTDCVPFNEAGLLKLNCDKAKFYLNWASSLSYLQTVRMIVDWYKAYYLENKDMNQLTDDQISHYEIEYARTLEK